MFSDEEARPPASLVFAQLAGCAVRDERGRLPQFKICCPQVVLTLGFML